MMLYMGPLRFGHDLYRDTLLSFIICDHTRCYTLPVFDVS